MKAERFCLPLLWGLGWGVNGAEVVVTCAGVWVELWRNFDAVVLTHTDQRARPVANKKPPHRGGLGEAKGLVQLIQMVSAEEAEVERLVMSLRPVSLISRSPPVFSWYM